MIPRILRLPSDEFRARGYETHTTPFFSLRVKKNSFGRNRIGVVIGLAIDKRAVRRNFWKRQAKAHLLRVPNVSKDFLVIFSPKIKQLTKIEFVKEIEKALHGLSLSSHL
jgi:ribonuclease P protein component